MEICMNDDSATIKSSILAFPPGEYIADELEARNLTQEDFAQRLGKKKSYVSELINGKRVITYHVAEELEAALGVSIDFWLNCQKRYDEYTGRMASFQENLENIRRRKYLEESFPLKEMFKREWIHKTEDIDFLENSIKHFYGVEDLTQVYNNCYSARKADYSQQSILQCTWFKRAEILAIMNEKKYHRFDDSIFEEKINQVKYLLNSPNTAREIIEFYQRMGIIIIAIKSLPNMKMQAAQFWINKKTPVIALTFHGVDSLDRFLFTLFHETAHILYKDALDKEIFEETLFEKDDKEKPEQEKRADDFAEEILLNKNEYAILKKDIIGKPMNIILQIAKKFSKERNIDISIVVGRLQKDGYLQWNLQIKKTNIFPLISDMIITDSF